LAHHAVEGHRIRHQHQTHPRRALHRHRPVRSLFPIGAADSAANGIPGSTSRRWAGRWTPGWPVSAQVPWSSTKMRRGSCAWCPPTTYPSISS
jgi:hypothetical protein